MNKKTDPSAPAQAKSAADLRQDRLKAALKENMGRRKAQARARKTVQAGGNSGKSEQ
ncbi:MAG: hypothetical protein JXR14_02530 [Paracoccaceae bacterium]